MQTAGCDAHLAFFFLHQVGRTALHGISLLQVGDAVSAFHDTHGEDKVIKQGILLNRLEEVAPDGKEFASCSSCRVEA